LLTVRHRRARDGADDPHVVVGRLRREIFAKICEDIARVQIQVER
jgi:hypothetical protein